jgi:hypothetical protein
MTGSKGQPLRNDAMRQALDRALSSSDRYLFTLLARFGNLPGPRPNYELAEAMGDELASRRTAADPLIIEMCSLDERQAPSQGSQVFLIVVGCHALAARYLVGFDRERAVDGLHELAGDPRKVVRDGVISALARLLKSADTAEILERLAGWTDGFLQAAVALEAVSSREVLERVRDGGLLVSRLEEATSLAENAGRAAERTQGRRRLLEVIPEAITAMGPRFPEVVGWLERRGATKHPELHASLEQALAGLQRAGVVDSDLDPVRKALDGSRPPLRDPTHYKGPTRGRGRKAQRRTERR